MFVNITHPYSPVQSCPQMVQAWGSCGIQKLHQISVMQSNKTITADDLCCFTCQHTSTRLEESRNASHITPPIPMATHWPAINSIMELHNTHSTQQHKLSQDSETSHNNLTNVCMTLLKISIIFTNQHKCGKNKGQID